MKKPAQVALLSAVALLLIASAVLFVRYRTTAAAFASSQAAEAAAQERYATTIDAIAQIQDSLNAISLGDTNVNLQTDGLQSEQLSSAKSQEALNRIVLLRSSILRNKSRILQLEHGLEMSSNKINGLQKMLAHLKQTLAEKEQLVAELTGRVDSLQTQVAGLATELQQGQETIQSRDQAIEEKRLELATVFVAVGNRSDLTKGGVVIATGGLLGFGKTLQPSPTAPDSQFTTLDTDQETMIAIDAARARVLSAQPADSYELVLVDGKMQLHILDPVAFRKIRQLVILTV